MEKDTLNEAVIKILKEEGGPDANSSAQMAMKCFSQLNSYLYGLNSALNDPEFTKLYQEYKEIERKIRGYPVVRAKARQAMLDYTNS